MGSLLKELSGSEIVAALEILSQHGVTKEHMRWLRTNYAYAIRAAHFMRDGSVALPFDIEARWAADLMEKNFFGPAEWYGYFTVEILQPIPEFPWNQQILKSQCPFYSHQRIKDTHSAFLGLDELNGRLLTPSTWKKRYAGERSVKRYFSYDYPYDPKVFPEKACAFRWYLTLKGGIPDSEDESFENQQKMLPPEYEVPSAAEEVTKLVLFEARNNEFPVNGLMLRCKETGAEKFVSYHVYVGSNGGAIIVGASNDFGSIHKTRLGASRNLPLKEE